MKQCKACGELKPATPEFFYRHRSGLHSKCRVCYNAYQAAARAKPSAKSQRAARLSSQREAINARQREYYAANAERWRIYYSEWDRAHPIAALARVHRRRARKVAASGSFTEDEWQRLLDATGHRCLACGLSGPLTRDHIVPLSRDGADDISNIQPLCRACNARKGTKSTDFRQLA